jgi:SAM-dependent methyltransferase
MPNLESLAFVEEQSKSRLYPRLTNPNWLVLRRRREIFRQWMDGFVQVDPVVLDVGGRVQPYRTLLKGKNIRYYAIDLKITPMVSVAGDARAIPFQDNVFDCVICTQVLDCVPAPHKVTEEIHRVLKPGGVLLLSVPSAFPRASEAERWRYLPTGIRQILDGFTQVEIVAEGSSIIGFFRTVNLCLQIFARYHWLRRLVNLTLVPVFNLTAAGLEALLCTQNDDFAVNYSVLARK